MYTVDATIEGVAALIQHKFGIQTQTQMEKPSKKRTGAPDYSEEWRDTCYLDPDSKLAQPGLHIEMAMVKAASAFKVPGGRGKTYKDLFNSAVFVRPDLITHNQAVPEKPGINEYDAPVYVDLRPVVVQRARVLRSHLALAPGWRLTFQIEVQDDEIRLDVVQDVLAKAGQMVGIGDYRPRYGRIRIANFEKAG